MTGPPRLAERPAVRAAVPPSSHRFPRSRRTARLLHRALPIHLRICPGGTCDSPSNRIRPKASAPARRRSGTPITTPWPVPCASTRTSWVRKRSFCVGGAGKADWSARRIGVLPTTGRGSPTVIKCSQLSVLPSRFGCMRTSARAEGAGHARYTFRVRVSKTARGALEAEWDRCRWLWNECVAKSKAMYLHNKATGGSAGRCSSRTCCRRRLPARRGCVRVHAFLFSVLLRRTPGVHPREESHPVVAMRSIAAAMGAERTQETGPQRPARNVYCSNAGTSGGG